MYLLAYMLYIYIYIVAPDTYISPIRSVCQPTRAGFGLCHVMFSDGIAQIPFSIEIAQRVGEYVNFVTAW